jgi:hypothetical protein
VVGRRGGEGGAKMKVMNESIKARVDREARRRLGGKKAPFNKGGSNK